MDTIRAKRDSVARKKLRIRKTVEGSAERPRLSVYRSEQHIYGQLIDDHAGRTLVATSSIAKDLRAGLAGAKPMDVAKRVGEALAEKAIAAGITKAVFDRNGRRYGGRVASLADGARGKGLQF